MRFKYAASRTSDCPAFDARRLSRAFTIRVPTEYGNAPTAARSSRAQTRQKGLYGLALREQVTGRALVAFRFSLKNTGSVIHLFRYFQLEPRLFLIQPPSSNDIKHERLASFDQ